MGEQGEDPAVTAWGRIFRDRALRGLDRERDRQIALWGRQSRLDGTGASFRGMADLFRSACETAAAGAFGASWRHVLLEEIYEALAEHEPDRLRAELVQAGAVIVAWIEDLDERKALSNGE